MEQIFRDSIAEHAQLTLTHQGPEGWRIFKATFSSGSTDGRQFAVQVHIPSEVPESSLPRPGVSLGITFRQKHKKFIFATVLRGFERFADHAVARLQWPENVQRLQRRVFERAEPPRNAAIAVRLWRETPGKSAPEERSVRHGQLENLSAGGMQVKVADPEEFEEGKVYRCIFTPRRGKPSIIVDALVRHRQAAEGGRGSIGFQFIGMEATPEGHNVLDRLARTVTEFQRTRFRRRDE